MKQKVAAMSSYFPPVLRVPIRTVYRPRTKKTVGKRIKTVGAPTNFVRSCTYTKSAQNNIVRVSFVTLNYDKG